MKRMRHTIKVRLRPKLTKRITIAVSLAVILAGSGAFIFLNLSPAKKAFGATTGDYRSKVSGNWSSTTTWERYNGSSWVSATGTPTSTSGVITIQNGHTVVITADVTADQIVVNSGGEIDLNSGDTLTIAAGTGNDLDVTGIFKNSGGVTINGGAIIVFKSGGKYQHNFTTVAGVIPTATWNSGSTCEIIGYTSLGGSITTGNYDQNFYHFTWNCPNQTTGLSVAGLLVSISGDLTITSTGTGNFQLANSATATVDVAGNFSQSAGTFILSNSSGTIDLSVKGNFSLTGGTFQEGGGNGDVNFNGTSPQTFTKSGGTISGGVDFAIVSGATVNFGTSVLTGTTATFDLQSGGGIMIGSTTGLTSTGSSGPIQVGGAKTYSTGADYTYNGSSSQVTGSGLPATVHNLTVNNSTGVTLTNTTTVSNLLTLTSGKLTTGSNELKVTNTSTSAISWHNSTCYVIGNLRRSMTSSGSYDYPLGTAANYELINITVSSITGFANVLGTFTNANPIEGGYPLTSLYLSGTLISDMLDYGYWTLTPNSSITGGSYSVTLNEAGQTNPGALATSHCVLKRSGLGSSWLSSGTHTNSTQSISGGVVSAQRTGLTSFSHYGIGKGGGAFPIELAYFKAELNGNHTDLSWATASELNNDHFTIERSSDGIHFEEILSKPGAGNSTHTIYYTAVDENSLKGYSYYKLKQTDYDGHFTYSDVKTVNNKAEEKNEGSIKLISVAPNPFSEKFKISFISKTAANVQFLLMNSSGQTVFNYSISSNEGMNDFDFIDERGLPAGIYFMNLIYNQDKITQKIIKN